MKVSKGIFNWSFLLIVIAGLVIINIIASLVYKRIDMTVDQRYSLAQGTIDFLEDDKNFDNTLTLKIYLAGDLPAEFKVLQNAIEDKLKEFKVYAGNRIQYTFLDPNPKDENDRVELHQNLYNKGKGILPIDLMFQKDAQNAQMLIWPGAVIDYEGSTTNNIQFLPGTQPGKPYRLAEIQPIIQNAINNLEYILISSIRRAIVNKPKKIGFLQGHGELRFAETQRARALISPYYAVDDVTIDGQIRALEGFDGLIIADPRSAFSDKDLYIIDQFVMRGGRLMVFQDALNVPEDSLEASGMTHTARNTTRLERLLFQYGLKLNENLIIDARCAPKVMPYANKSLLPWIYHVLATPTNHAISRNVEPVSLKYVNEIQFIEKEGVALTPILTSSTNSASSGLAPLISFAQIMNYNPNNMELVPNPEDEINKKCLAGLAEGYFESYYRNRIVDTYTKNSEAIYNEKSTKEGKVVLVGNGRWIQNSYDSMPNKMSGQMMYRPKAMNDLRMDEQLAQMQVPIFFGNQEFFQNLVDYVMGDNSVLDIRSRQIDIHEMDKTKVNQGARFYKMLNMIVPSVIVLLFAALMFFIRKRKFAKAK